jgi:hypothetical protein
MKKRDELWNIRRAFAQRRHAERENVQSIEEIRAKATVSDSLFQITVGRGDDQDVDPDGTAAAYWLELLLLQDAQQLDLVFERQFTDFIEEDGATVGEFKAPETPVDGAREGL